MTAAAHGPPPRSDPTDGHTDDEETPRSMRPHGLHDADPTERLLLDLCRRPTARRSEAAGASRLATPTGIAGLMELASEGAVTGIVLSRLFESDTRLPTALRDELAGSLADQKRRARAWILERDRLARRFAGEALDLVVLKGAALCTEWYEDPTHRAFGDLDLLVAERDLEAALAVLREAGYEMATEGAAQGYREHHFHYRLVHRAGFIAELHWGLSRPGEPFTLRPEHFLAHARPAGGRVFRTPAPEHMLLHSVQQSVAEGLIELRRLLDVDRICARDDGLDRARLVADARDADLGAPLWLALSIARDLLGTEVDPSLLAEVRPGAVTRAHLGVLAPERAVFPTGARGSVAFSDLLRLWLLPDLPARARFLGGRVLDRRDPLDHLWSEEGAPEAGPHDGSFVRGLAHLGKLLGAQALLYAEVVRTRSG